MEGIAFGDSMFHCHANMQDQKELNNAHVNRVCFKVKLKLAP
jgi:hypothetical protein